MQLCVNQNQTKNIERVLQRSIIHFALSYPKLQLSFIFHICTSRECQLKFTATCTVARVQKRLLSSLLEPAANQEHALHADERRWRSVLQKCLQQANEKWQTARQLLINIQRNKRNGKPKKCNISICNIKPLYLTLSVSHMGKVWWTISVWPTYYSNKMK